MNNKLPYLANDELRMLIDCVSQSIANNYRYTYEKLCSLIEDFNTSVNREDKTKCLLCIKSDTKSAIEHIEMLERLLNKLEVNY